MEEEDTGQAGPADAGNLPEPEPLSPAVEAEPEVVVVEDEAEDGGDEFSFPVPPFAAAADACIVPVYPIFGRPPSPPPSGEVEELEPATATVRVPLGRLLLEEREFRAREREQDGRSASARRAWEYDASDDDASSRGGGGDEDLEGVPPETYCLWAPGGGGGGAQASASASPRQCRKSGSTGSVLRWRRISDRLVGRSHSDGKEKFVFLSAATAAGVPEPPRRSIKEEEEGGGDADSVGRQLRYYARGGGSGGSGSRRRSYLPYKQELVGLFANVSGLRRSYQPF